MGKVQKTLTQSDLRSIITHFIDMPIEEVRTSVWADTLPDINFTDRTKAREDVKKKTRGELVGSIIEHYLKEYVLE